MEYRPRVRLCLGRRGQGVRRHRRQGAARVDERAPRAASSLRGRPRGRGRGGPGRGEALRVDGGGTESDEKRGGKVVRGVQARPRMMRLESIVNQSCFGLNTDSHNSGPVQN